ncbi:hypothetical protein [Streptacidiphilus fuscans]|uniref:Uncharacterized protein n=1 Tax=Streptacidiphilus fuscans TaxID=2789292 RepID=A0A931BC24_9ACTN|nr:hypothetical protein [Streptacidiphilus fuscans]MBF9071657.1 hypothetical protein [Streptacidiphilus fuscans]MBF9072856.1 hypothetical protein [Streptacidiphilus fuscans]
MNDSQAGPKGPDQRLRCCICGQQTESADDYVVLELSSEESNARQYFGAHAEHLNSVLAQGFNVEVHLM